MHELVTPDDGPRRQAVRASVYVRHLPTSLFDEQSSGRDIPRVLGSQSLIGRRGTKAEIVFSSCVACAPSLGKVTIIVSSTAAFEYPAVGSSSARFDHPPAQDGGHYNSVCRIHDVQGRDVATSLWRYLVKHGACHGQPAVHQTYG